MSTFVCSTINLTINKHTSKDICLMCIYAVLYVYVGIRDCEPKLIICSSVGLEGMNKVRYTYTYIHTFLFHSTRV